MHLSRLTVRNFRALANVDVELQSSNLFVGPNGAGKSTILDAVRVLITGRSLRGHAVTWSSAVSTNIRPAQQRIADADHRPAPLDDPSNVWVVGQFGDLTADQHKSWHVLLIDNHALRLAAVIRVGASVRELGVLLTDEALQALSSKAFPDHALSPSAAAKRLRAWLGETDRCPVTGEWWVPVAAFRQSSFLDMAEISFLLRDERVIDIPPPGERIPGPDAVMGIIARHDLDRKFATHDEGLERAIVPTEQLIETVDGIHRMAGETLTTLQERYEKALSQYLGDVRNVSIVSDADADQATEEMISAAIGDLHVDIERPGQYGSMPLQSSGSGTRRAALVASLELFTFDDIWDPDDWLILLIEEPEVGLDAEAQRRVASSLSDLHRYGIQTIVTSHSAAVMDRFGLKQTLVVRRSVHASAPSVEVQIERPTVLDEVVAALGARPSDALLATTFVVVEGEIDAAAISAWARAIGVDLRGLGIQLVSAGGHGWASTISAVLKISSPLARVVALLDGDAQAVRTAKRINREHAGGVVAHALSRPGIEGYFAPQAVERWLVSHGGNGRIEPGPVTKHQLRLLARKQLHRNFRGLADSREITSLMVESEVDPEIKSFLVGLASVTSSKDDLA